MLFDTPVLRRTASIGVLVALCSVFAVTASAAAGPAVSTRGYRVTVFETGGPVETGYSSTRLPVVHINDGKVYTPAANSQQTLKVRVRTAGTAELRTLVNALYDAAVTPVEGFGTLPFDIATTMRIVVTTEHGTRAVSVHAFEYQPGFDYLVGAEAGAARKRLYEAVKSLVDMQGRATTYNPTQFEIWERPGTVDHIPVKLRTTPVASATPGCATLKASSVPSGTLRTSGFQLPNKKKFQAFVRPALPGETICTRA